MTTHSLSNLIIDDVDGIHLYDLGRLDITATSLRNLIDSIPADYMTSNEDAADLYHDIAKLYDYLSADMLDDVYNADDPDSAPEVADALDHASTELHIALSNLDNMIDLSALIR